MVVVLLDHGADIEAKTNSGETPLHLAAEFNKEPAVVKVLLDRGVDAQARSKSGEIPLFVAIRRANTEAIEVLRGHVAR